MRGRVMGVGRIGLLTLEVRRHRGGERKKKE